ncbi:hypothetical protein [Nodosilinea sp. E11]|uniref:hypothetical protein n=1 Tax=Nodosilinea sp. E11 TaxID=3037479 RepID=UPI0029346E2B|nr:hypothetical protein [Nodosilinea sp. E11]WOD37231.1 hypothetical protein RRF56_01865 [Nodosilinea sp. E11]
MPMMEVWKASTVFVVKRSLSAGCAGIGNPPFIPRQFLDGNCSTRLTGASE